MDFNLIELDDHDRALQLEIREFLDTIFTPEVTAHEDATGSGHDEGVARALGARGWLYPSWPVEQGGAGFNRLQQHIMDVELQKKDFRVMLMVGTSRLPMSAVRKYMAAELADPILRKCASGEAMFCLGYSEPDGGSDIANAKVRAVRDGDMWSINGSKMWTTGAQVATHTFLITRTDPDAPKHKGLTMFLVPLDTPGIEIQAIQTYGGERTNIVFYEDVQVHDRYRLGEVNEGWSVVHGPLDEEHGEGRDKSDGLSGLSMGTAFAKPLGKAINEVGRWAKTNTDPFGTAISSDPHVLRTLGDAMVDYEVAVCTPGPMGRYNGADALIRSAARLQDLLGPAGLIPRGAEGVIGNGDTEYAHRFAQGTSTYGGTTEVFRTIVAQHVLGLPKPNYPGAKVFNSGKRER